MPTTAQLLIRELNGSIADMLWSLSFRTRIFSLPPHKALQYEDIFLKEDQTWLTQEMVFTAVVGAQSTSMQDSGAHHTQLTFFLLLSLKCGLLLLIFIFSVPS
jgi:hypothetical protein